MAFSLGPAEEILLYYSGTSELNPPKAYTMSKILYQHAGDGVFVVTLNDPKTLNSICKTSGQEMALVIEHARRDDRCKALVWTGAGRAFCAGGNFAPNQHSTVPDEIMDGYMHAGICRPSAVMGATRAMVKFPKTSIAAVNGIAVGAGVNLAFVWHDLCLVAEGLKFRYPFGELGITPELGSSVWLPSMIGLSRAKELMQLGREFSAQRAQELGLVSEVLPVGELLPRALAIAKQMAAMPQEALRMSKLLVNAQLIQAIDTVVENEHNFLQKSLASPETQRAMAALKAKSTKSQSKL